jgi:hypothetical protein
MAKKHKAIGTGITARALTEYSGEDIGPFSKDFFSRWNAACAEGGGRFGAVVRETERVCRRILAGAGGGLFEADTVEDYAARILKHIDVTKAAIKRGDADGAARLGVVVGCLLTEAWMKEEWEAHALRGKKNAEVLSEARRAVGRNSSAKAKRLWAEWQARADKIWAGKTRISATGVAKIIARETGDKASTIRRIIHRKVI